MFFIIIASSKESSGKSSHAYLLVGYYTPGYEDIIDQVIKFYANEGIEGCNTWKEVEGMEKINLVVAKLMFYLDRHYKKMSRCTGFKVPNLFAPLIRATKRTMVLRKLNKKRLKDLVTMTLKDLSK